MALKLNYVDDLTEQVVEESYLKASQIRINKPNGFIEVVAEAELYASQTAKDNGKKSICSVRPLIIGKKAYADGELSPGDRELPQNVKDAIDVLFAYTYATFKELRYPGALDV